MAPKWLSLLSGPHLFQKKYILALFSSGSHGFNFNDLRYHLGCSGEAIVRTPMVCLGGWGSRCSEHQGLWAELGSTERPEEGSSQNNVPQVDTCFQSNCICAHRLIWWKTCNQFVASHPREPHAISHGNGSTLLLISEAQTQFMGLCSNRHLATLPPFTPPFPQVPTQINLLPAIHSHNQNHVCKKTPSDEGCCLSCSTRKWLLEGRYIKLPQMWFQHHYHYYF